MPRDVGVVLQFPQPDRAEMDRFVRIVFARADADTAVNLRAFADGREKDEPFAPNDWHTISVGDGLDSVVSGAMALAQRCAADRQKAVFCPPVATFKGYGTAEANIANGLVLMVECDRNARASRERLDALLGPATVVVESGGIDADGEPKLHIYWVLEEPTRTEEDHGKLKAARRLACDLVKADASAVPIGHALRWPGSWHRKGDPRMARIVGGDPARVINLDDALAGLSDEAGWWAIEEGDHQPGRRKAPLPWLGSAMAKIPNDDLEWETWNKLGLALWAATDGSAEGLALFDGWSAKSSKYDKARTKDRWDRYRSSPPTKIGAGTIFFLARQADPDWRPPSAVVADLNREYAVVLAGNKTVILREGIGDEGQPEWRLITTGAFHEWMAPRTVKTGDDGKEKATPLSRLWIRHPQRRQYEGLVFAPKRDLPRHYNLWRGFAVEPRKGNCDLFLDHLRSNACNGVLEHYEWVLAWFADIFQNPGRKPGTALVICGPPGIGKTKIFDVVGSLLGPHYVKVTDPRYITGTFNAHLVACLLLFADEGFWAGDKAAEGRLRDLITGDEHFIEFKHVQPFRVRNFIRFSAASQQEWVVPATFRERRFAAFNGSEAKIQDHRYFAAIDEQMANGGREALLWHLLHEVDVGGVNLRDIPKTEALLEQKVAGLDPAQAWLFDTLQRGALPDDRDGAGKCRANAVYSDYIDHAKQRGARHLMSETAFGMFLFKHTPGLTKKKESWPGEAKRVYVYQFPDLRKCRAAFAAKAGQNIRWDDAAGQWEADQERPAKDERVLF